MDPKIINNDLIKFRSVGEGSKVFIFSPLFPFQNGLFEAYFSSLNFPDAQFIYSVLNYSYKIKKSEINLGNFIEAYQKLIGSFGEEKKIFLVSFGFFSIAFSKLFLQNNKKIESIIYFEPDLSNSVLMKLFDSAKKPIFKYRFLLNFYLNNKKENSINNSKKNLKYLKYFYYNIKEHLESNRILKDLIEHKEKIIIFWKVMEKDSWPLSQILQVEYNLPVVTLNETIFDSITKSDELISEKFREILG